MTALPPPSAELVLIAAFVQAHLDSLPSKARARFLKRTAENLAKYADLSTIRRIRAPHHDAAYSAAVAEASEWYTRLLPFVVGREDT